MSKVEIKMNQYKARPEFSSEETRSRTRNTYQKNRKESREERFIQSRFGLKSLIDAGEDPFENTTNLEAEDISFDPSLHLPPWDLEEPLDKLIDESLKLSLEIVSLVVTNKDMEEAEKHAQEEEYMTLLDSLNSLSLEKDSSSEPICSTCNRTLIPLLDSLFCDVCDFDS